MVQLAGMMRLKSLGAISENGFSTTAPNYVRDTITIS